MIISYRKIFNKLISPFFLLVLVIILFQNITFAGPPSYKDVTIIGYQGVLEEAPENTMAAFKRLVELGAKGLMVDVRQTKDKKVVLMHDETIDRTTDGKGVLGQLLFDELRVYDAGSWRGEKFAGEKVPLLSEVLKFAKDNELKLVVDVKPFGIENRILSIVKEFDMIENVYFLGVLRNVSQLEPGLPIHNLIFAKPDDLSKDLLSFAHDRKNFIAVKMIDSDDRELLKRSINKKTDVVILNYPHLIMDVFHQNKIKEVKNVDYSVYFKSNKIEISGNRELVKIKKSNTPLDSAAFIRDEPYTLLNVIQSENEDDSRMAALAASSSLSDRTISELISLLNNKKSHVRKNAVWALGLTYDKLGLMPILGLFDDKDNDVKREAILALKRLISSCAFTYDEFNLITDNLIKILGNDADANVRYDAARTLQDLRAIKAVPQLIKSLGHDSDWAVRAACAGALGDTKDENGIGPLRNLLMHDTKIGASWARKRAAWALAKIGGKAINSLIIALGDNEENTRRRACWALVEIGKPAVQALVSALKNSQSAVRERAALALGWIKDNYAVSGLLWGLNDKDPTVRLAIVWALGRIGDKSVLEPLEKVRKDKNIRVRMNIMESIGRIKKSQDEP